MECSAAPKSARVLAVLSISLSALFLLLYFIIVLLQRVYKPWFSYDPEIIAYFSVPLAPFLSVLVLFIVQLVFCIILLASGNKAVWSQGKGVAFCTVEAVLLAGSGLLMYILPLLEGKIYASFGSNVLVSYNIVTSLVEKAIDFFNGSVICSLIAFALVIYKASLNKKPQ